MVVTIIAWMVLGARAGWVANFVFGSRRAV